MGCPGQARTRPRRNHPSQRCRRRRLMAAAAAIKSRAAVTCAAQPHNAMRDQRISARSFLASCPTMCATNCAWNGGKSQAIVRLACDKKLVIAWLACDKKTQLSLKDTASRGPTTIVAPESQFRTCPSDHALTYIRGLGLRFEYPVSTLRIFPDSKSCLDTLATVHRTLSYSIAGDVPVLLIEYQDAVFEDERVVPIYLGGERVTPVPHLPVGFDSRYERSG
ncbi:hypothetical protein F511_04099 [Dorcoceras hygrometricum]|uniref:Uncharacterized protein n=1 Tax=Dorcoceras hygrometricum TaxID=472368 RepID=A0A2Z7D6L5_9LAMI|nr:hypothetical protein F511_04099 [Dorcoceras hygrometricum]